MSPAESPSSTNPGTDPGPAPVLRRRARVVGLSGAALLTATAVGIGVLAPVSSQAPEPAAYSSATASASTALRTAVLSADRREVGTSRSVDRTAVVEVEARTPTVTGRLWTTEPLRLRVQPRERARDVGTVEARKRVAVTGKRTNGYAEVVVDERSRWVAARFLSERKPAPPQRAARSGSSDGSGSSGSSGSSGAAGSTSGLNTAPCANGAVASGGLQPRAQLAMNAVCNAFPEITTYGGYAPRGEHGGGMAVDVMVRGATGDRIAQFLYQHRAELGLSNIIWAQTIWSAERGGEGFRPMENRGSDTANHYDHVHVLVG